MQELEQLRLNIDEIDAQLLELLAKRQEVVKHVGEYKQKHCIDVFDATREKYLHDFHQQLSRKYNLPFEFISNIFNMIIEESKRTQIKAK